ncbi:hypothetical protein [Streptomyces sp. NBC_00076]|uniref:hypothetical protein n=1 Tax=Streptomyces sp. NBC_00076 TaxID=2975642 RepID=UPI003252FF4C
MAPPTPTPRRRPPDEAPFLSTLRPRAGARSPEDQAAVDQFRALLAALRDPDPWPPAHARTSPSGSAPS